MRKKSAEKNAEINTKKKVTKKTQGQYSRILSAMQPDIWYKAADFAEVVDVGGRRVEVLLSELVELDMLESSGATKGKKYRIKSAN